MQFEKIFKGKNKHIHGQYSQKVHISGHLLFELARRYITAPIPQTRSKGKLSLQTGNGFLCDAAHDQHFNSFLPGAEKLYPSSC